jgi:ABC-type multidrug transport system ATPase subunit
MCPAEPPSTAADPDDPPDRPDDVRLRLDGVGKRYGDVWGVRDVSLDLGPGVVGLLGPNGAGKSTLMRILTTYLQPTEGTVTFDGTDVVDSPNAVRERVGYLPQEFGVYPDLTAEEFLSYLAAIRGLDRMTADERIGDLLALTNLRDARDRRLGGFSGGMRQRVGIAQALLTDPDLLVVDEPTVGLDPAERVRFRNVLSSLGDDRVVVLSTHIVSDVESTASEVAVLDEGTPRGEAGTRQRRARLVGQVLGEDRQALRRERRVLREGTVDVAAGRPPDLLGRTRAVDPVGGERRRDAVAFRESVDVRPDLDDFAGPVRTRDDRERHARVFEVVARDGEVAVVERDGAEPN